jgi:acetyl-CoA carboxylase carboxyl transferase subunit beta
LPLPLPAPLTLLSLLQEHNHICFSCNFHLKMSSAERIEHMIDPGTWRPLDETLSPVDPLEFVDLRSYPDRVKEAQDKMGMQDGVRTGTGLLHGIPVALGVMDFGYMGGSMGSVVGEKLTRLIEYATQEGLALIIVSTSGGARMQEGIFSLMQMAKISGALHVHQNEANLLFISILTSPTLGGVTASFGMLGDIIIAEPQAIIGFAGRRVIEQTLQEQLPDDFQTAEYLLDKGQLDLVVPRSFLKGALFEIIDFYRDAPYKKQGRIPFGVQHGVFLNTEEKVRRKVKEWGAGSSGNGKVPSYQELVSSMRVLIGEAGSVDVKELAKDEAALSEAFALARTGKMEWVQSQKALLTGKDEYQFKFKDTKSMAAAANASSR